MAREPEMARRFADTLVQSERTGDVEPLVALFADQADLQSLLHAKPIHGIAEIRRFWQDYRASFRDLRSRFERISDDGRIAVLEWVSDGTLASGERVAYRGVSLIEHDGERVERFRTYYDTAALSGRHAHRSPAR
jgi:ketosteroid isomerase-like protein